MRAPPENQTAPVAGRGGGDRHSGSSIRDHSHSRSPHLNQVAVVRKSASAEIRVSLKSWRGSNAVEIREATAAIPGIFFPTPNGVTFDVERLPELITALQAAESEARVRGVLGKAGAV
jgi:hypothetical protein